MEGIKDGKKKREGGKKRRKGGEYQKQQWFQHVCMRYSTVAYKIRIIFLEVRESRVVTDG